MLVGEGEPAQAGGKAEREDEEADGDLQHPGQDTAGADQAVEAGVIKVQKSSEWGLSECRI